MSSIDERIVEMQFDNDDFERGVQTSLVSLAKLKQGLNLDASARSLSNLEKVGKSFSLANVADSVQVISDRFSALGIMGVTALQNITNSAVNAGKRIVSALTIDPIKTGFSEYETKIGAIQTILTNTESKGTTLEDVNRVLAELNTYADQTIYNFAEMTRNIGTFTAAGIELDTAATAIKGIANLAAGSGSTSQQASTAMYQLSQALAAGTVKLMDWNSVVNAGMGGELFQNALKKTAKEMGVFVDETQPFRETLQTGWLSSDVLIKTLEGFAENETLVKAATQVKTFTQLFDTMKESVQSGWAVSWENVIGDKEQSTKMLTDISDAFNDMVGPVADARNEMLKFWNQNGGRDAAIEAISEALKTLKKVLKPVGEAFRDLFPRTTGQQLVDITNKFKNLVSNIKVSDEFLLEVKQVFTGLFSVVDAGISVIASLASVVWEFAGKLSPVASGLWDITVMFANFLTDVSNAIKSTTVITGVFGALGKMLDTIGKKISGVSGFFGDLYSAIKGLASGLITGVANELKTLIENLDFSTVFNIISAGLFTAILKKVKGFVDDFTNKFVEGFEELKDGFGVLSGLTDILDSVRASLETWQMSLNVNMLTSIAKAIGMISASLVALATIDSDDLIRSLGGVGVILVELVGALTLMQTMFNSVGQKALFGLHQLSAILIGLSTSVLILSGSMKVLGSLDLDQISRSLVGVAGLSAILVATATKLSAANKKLVKGATGLVILSGAIMILSEAVLRLGSIDAKAMINGLLGVGTLCAQLALFFDNTNLDNIGLFKGIGILAMAGALTVLAAAVYQLSRLNLTELAKGVGAIGLLLAELSLFMNYTANSSGVLLTATSMAVMAASLLALAGAIKYLAGLKLSEVGTALIALGGSLAILAGGLHAMNGTLAGSAALLVAATALGGLAYAVGKSGLSAPGKDGVKSSLVLFAGGLTALAIALRAMNGTLAGSAALLVASGAMVGLATAVKILKDAKFKDVAVALGVLGGAFAGIAVASGVLAAMSPVVMVAAKALLAFGAAVAVVGAGTLALGAGLTSMGAGLASILALGSGGLKAFADAAVTIFERLINLIPTIFATITATLPAEIPKLIDALVSALSLFLQQIAIRIPEFAQAGLSLIRGLLDSVEGNIGEIVSSGIGIAVNFIKGVASKIPDVIQAGIELMVSFLNGLADGLRANSKIVGQAISNVVSAILEAAIEVAMGFVSGFLQVGVKIISGFIDGMQKMYKKVVNAIASVGKTIVDKLSETVSKVYTVGKNIIEGFVNGIKESIAKVVSAAADMANSVVDKVKEVLDIHSPSGVMEEVGEDTVDGFTNGILSKTSEVEAAAMKIFEETFGNAVEDAIQKVADSMKYGGEAFIAYMANFGMVSGEFKTLKENITATAQVMTDYGKQLYEESEYYKEDTEALRENEEELAKLKKTRKELQNDLAKYSKQNTSESKKRVTEIKNELEQVEDSIKATTEAISDYPNQVLAHTQEVYIQLANTISSSIKDSIDPLKVSLTTQVDLFKKFEVETEEVTESVLSNMESQVVGITQWNNNLKKLSEKGFAKGLLDQLEILGPSGSTYIRQFMNMTTEEITKANELFQESTKLTAQALIQNFDESLQAAKTWALNMQALSNSGLNQDIIESLGNMGLAGSDYVDAFMSMSSEQIKKFNEQYSEYLTLPDEVTNQVIASFANAGVNGASGFTDSIISETNPESAATKKIEENALNIGQTLATGVSDGIKSKQGSVKTSSTALSKAAYNALNTYMSSSRGNSLGTEVCMGVITGLKNNQSAVSAAAAAVAAQALAAAKAELEIKSPSRKFAEVGKYADEGLISGLLAYARRVSDAASDVGRTALDGLRNSIARISAVVNDEMDTTPVIRPVIDLTKVHSGIGELNGMVASTRGMTLSVANSNANAISRSMNNQNGAQVVNETPTQKGDSIISFVQNNYSPTALSRKEIYRQTNNQFSAAREALSKI